MADEILRSRHAFGNTENLDAAISAGKIDAYDILFLDGDTDKPKIGWIDRNGNAVILEDEKADLSKVEEDVDKLESSFTDLESEVAKKADAKEVETELATKANTEDVNLKIEQSVNDVKSYTDGKVEAALNEHLVRKFEISNTPEGTLVNYGEKEIRVMCPANAVFTKQSVGSTGNANMYYMAFKAYAPEGAVSFKEGDKGEIIDEMFTFDDDFAGTDEYGRNYSICWFALASYDENSDTWSYFGKNSSFNKYLGWTYCVEWYDVNGVMIASDYIRINLSNEGCHSEIMPYYMADISKEFDTKIEQIISEVEAAYEVIEF